MAFALNTFNAQSGKLDGDVDMHIAPEKAVGIGAMLEVMALHAETECVGLEHLLLGPQRVACLALPPAGRMDEGRVGGIEKADGREIGGAGKSHAGADLRRGTVETGNRRDDRQSRRIGLLAHEDPDIALDLAARNSMQAEPAGVDVVGFGECRSCQAAPVVGTEQPTMVAALQRFAVALPVAQRHATMWTTISVGENLTVAPTTEQDVALQERHRQSFAQPECVACCG